LEPPAIEELLGLGLELQLDRGASPVVLAGLDREVAVALAAPDRGLAAGLARECGDHDLVGDHERAVETDPELSDQAELASLADLTRRAGLLDLLEVAQGARVGDGPEV